MPTSNESQSVWSRRLPLSGAVFTVLMVVAAVAFPMPPGGDVSPASKPAWLAAHYNAVIAQSYLRALAAVAFIAMAVAVAAAVRRASPEPSRLPALAAFGGALSGGLLLIAQATSLAAALFVHSGGSPDTARALGALQGGFLDLSSIPSVLLFGAVGAAALRSGILPRWLALFSIAGVPFAMLDSLSYDGGPLEAVGLLGLLYLLAWSLLAGIKLYSTSRINATSPTPDRAANLA